jgi:hypothetical protein
VSLPSHHLLIGNLPTPPIKHYNCYRVVTLARRCRLFKVGRDLNQGPPDRYSCLLVYMVTSKQFAHEIPAGISYRTSMCMQMASQGLLVMTCKPHQG